VLAVLSWAVGIGLATALGSIADAILFRPLPVIHPNEIVRIFTASPGSELGFVSFPDYTDLRDRSRALAGMVAAQTQVMPAVETDASGPGEVRLGLAVTSNYFDVLGVPAAIGRTFSPDESRSPVIVLAHDFWRTRYGADASVPGRPIRIGTATFVIIGVAPKGFGLDRFLHEDFYIPIEAYGAGLGANPLTDRAKRFLTVYGRLARGFTAAEAQAEVRGHAARLAAEYPDTNRGRRAVVLTELGARLRSDRTMPALSGMFLAVSVLVLAIACTNVAGLLLMRAEAKRREFAIRMAMGSDRGRLLSQLLTETFLLAGAGAALGMPLAWGALHGLARLVVLPTDLPFALATRIDGRAVTLTLGITSLAALACGAAPWLASRKVGIAGMLKAGGAAPDRGGIFARNALVTAAIALALMLVATGGLLVKNLVAEGAIDLGYRTDHVLVLTLDPSQSGYDEVRTRNFYHELLERVRRLPGVRSAALGQSVPLGYTGAQRQVGIGGQPSPTGQSPDKNELGASLSVWTNTVSAGYFELMRIRIVSGRVFEDRDTAASPSVAVINEELAQIWSQSWRGGSAVGSRIQVNGRSIEVIGVVRTAKYFQVGETPRPFLYLPYSQNFAARMVVHIETEGAPSGGAAAVPDVRNDVRGEVRGLDAQLPVTDIRALDKYFSQGGLFEVRVAVYVVGGAAACGLLLALIGLHGLIASAVERRRREIGIRIAVGADQRMVIVLVLGHGCRLVLVGTTGGLAAAMEASRLIVGLIAGATGTDAKLLAGSALVVAVASLSACVVPLWRAAKTDPVVALRHE